MRGREGSFNTTNDSFSYLFTHKTVLIADLHPTTFYNYIWPASLVLKLMLSKFLHLLFFLHSANSPNTLFTYCALSTFTVIFYLPPVGHSKTTGQHSFTLHSTSRDEFWSVVIKTKLLLACAWITYYMLKKKMYG